MSIPIGKRIKKARQDLELTQEQVAKMIGFSRQALSKIEKGITESPDTSNLISLAKALNNNFGEEWLNEYLDGTIAAPSKTEIIENATPEEIVGIKFGGGATVRRDKAEILRLQALLNKKLKEMEDEGEKK